MKKYFKLLRVKHYIKTFLVFLPIMFSGKLTDTNVFYKSVLGFIAFCAVSSAVYIFNDIKDVEKDRNHPKKRNRPIASGQIKIKTALFISVVLLATAITCLYFANGNLLSWLILATYLLMNICYSAGLKNVPLLDVAILSAGFLLRVMFGAAITDIKISNWLYLTIISISFYFGLGKRRNELLKQNGDETRKVLQFYNAKFLDKNMYVCLTLGIVFYSLWCVDGVTVEKLGNIIWTIPCVLIICMKYSLTIEKDSDGDPVEVLLHDKFLLIMTVIFCIALALVIYAF